MNMLNQVTTVFKLELLINRGYYSRMRIVNKEIS